MPTTANQPPPDLRYLQPPQEMTEAVGPCSSPVDGGHPCISSNSIGAVTLAASLCMTSDGAFAFDESKFPDWKGAWRRVAVPGIVGQPSYDPTKRGGAAQQAPLTAGISGDLRGQCQRSGPAAGRAPTRPIPAFRPACRAS